MGEPAVSERPLREKALREFKEFAALSVYLYACLGALVLFKSAVLQEAGIYFAIWGIPAIKALILAKFMLLGRALHPTGIFGNKPLIWPTVFRALTSLILLLVLTTVEELVVGFIHGRTIGDSLGHVVGPTALQGLAVCLIMLLILVPYSAFISLGEVLGERQVFRLFFVSRAADGAIRDHLADRMPPAQVSG